MTIYIPIIPILIWAGIYLSIGALSYPVLYRWQDKFISKSPSDRNRWYAPRLSSLISGIFACAVAWPVVLCSTIKTEIKHGTLFESRR